jgi:hypothetical protein
VALLDQRSIENVRLIWLRNPIPHYPKLAHSTPGHSHSMISKHRNALSFQRKFFLHIAKNRPTDPSKICALEFKSEFRRSAIFSVPATIDINRSIFHDERDNVAIGLVAKKYRQSRLQRNRAI